jgi:hypothetical protein
LEEFAKAKWVEHCYYSSVTNSGFPGAVTEQGWLKLLYIHLEKQYAFVARDMFEYPPALVDFLKIGKLERRKQQAVYVGLERGRKNVDYRGKSRAAVSRATITASGWCVAIAAMVASAACITSGVSWASV